MEGNVAIGGGHHLHYRVDGPAAAPPVLLINSLGCTLDMWAPQVPAFSQDYRLIRYDVRGHGRSSSPPGEYTIADLGQDAVRVLDAAGADRAHVCGISLGGLTTMWLGVHQPARVRTLVIANTAARVGTRERWAERIATVRAEGMAAIADMVVKAWFTPAFLEREPATVARLHGMVASTDPAGYIACCAALREADLRPEIRRITARALVVAGAHDATTTVADAQFIWSQLRSAQQVTLPGAHLTNVEFAAEFSRHALALFAADAASTIGEATRRRILGNAHVDRAIRSATPLTADFQDFLTRYVWGEIWTRPGLDHRTRRVLVIGTMIALGRWEEFAMHVRAAVREGGFTAEDIREIILQQAVYCGIPAANHAMTVAGEILGSDRVT